MQPNYILTGCHGSKVTVYLRNDDMYSGTLESYDHRVGIVLNSTKFMRASSEEVESVKRVLILNPHIGTVQLSDAASVNLNMALRAKLSAK